jgi:hypothetical protein
MHQLRLDTVGSVQRSPIVEICHVTGEICHVTGARVKLYDR